MSEEIKVDHVKVTDDLHMQVGFEVDGVVRLLKLDIDASERYINALVSGLGQLRSEVERSPAPVVTIEGDFAPGDRVRILSGSCEGREGEVALVTPVKVTVWHIQGLLTRERVQFLRNQLQKI